MLSIVLVCCGLIAADGGATASPGDPADVASYQAAASKAGHDARATCGSPSGASRTG